MKIVALAAYVAFMSLLSQLGFVQFQTSARASRSTVSAFRRLHLQAATLE
jgi:hypothetical protein